MVAPGSGQWDPRFAVSWFHGLPSFSVTWDEMEKAADNAIGAVGERLEGEAAVNPSEGAWEENERDREEGDETGRHRRLEAETVPPGSHGPPPRRPSAQASMATRLAIVGELASLSRLPLPTPLPALVFWRLWPDAQQGGHDGGARCHVGRPVSRGRGRRRRGLGCVGLPLPILKKDGADLPPNPRQKGIISQNLIEGMLNRLNRIHAVRWSPQTGMVLTWFGCKAKKTEHLLLSVLHARRPEGYGSGAVAWAGQWGCCLRWRGRHR